MNPTLDVASVSDFERVHSIELPEGYRAFLLEIGDGGAGPAYGLLPLSGGLAERGRSIYGLSDPFIAPASQDEHADFDAPGILPIQYHGCSYYDGLVVSGPERGEVWTYVEVRPGWVPVCHTCADRPLVDAAGQPWDGDLQAVDGYHRWYGLMLAERNRHLRVGFLGWYERWLDGVLVQ